MAKKLKNNFNQKESLKRNFDQKLTQHLHPKFEKSMTSDLAKI